MFEFDDLQNCMNDVKNYSCIIKIDMIDYILNFKKNICIFLSQLNYLRYECEKENINELIDEQNQQIIFNFGIMVGHKKVDDIKNFF